jgi:hypothetical protein
MTQHTATYPVDFNGYANVARPPLHIPASEVEVGDVVVVDGWLSKVVAIDRYQLGTTGIRCVHIQGPLNLVRAAYEPVTVLRSPTGETP